MKALTRAEIVKKTHGYQTEWVDIPEWGGKVLVRELTAEEVTKIGVAAIHTGEGLDPTVAAVRIEDIATVLPQVVSWTVVDEDLNSILSETDIKAMSGNSMEAIQTLAEKAFELSGLLEDEDEEPDPN